MAIGVDIIKTSGRLIFELERGEDTTTRTLDVAFPKTDTSTDELQKLVNNANTIFTSPDSLPAGDGYPAIPSRAMNVFVQPANWRDLNITEEQWVTKRVRYEIVTTSTTPIEPDTPVTLGSAQAQFEQHQEG